MTWNQQLPDFYSDWAASYGDSFSNELAYKPRDRELLNELAAKTPPGIVCDLGCGPGHIGAYLHKLGREVEGIDISEGMVSEASRRFPEITFKQGSFHALPVCDNYYSGMTAFYSLIHCERSKLENALLECERALKPGGRLLAAFHEGEQTILKEGVSFNFFTEAHLRDALATTTLSIERIEIRPSYPEENSDWSRLYLQLFSE